MEDSSLSAKEAYFEEQALLDVSDDEQDITSNASIAIEAALAVSRAMPPPTLIRQTSSFLGPTPKQRQAEFEAHAMNKRVVARSNAQRPLRSSTDPEGKVTRSFPITKTRQDLTSGAEGGKNATLKRVTSLPNLDNETVPFYKSKGEVPRELKQGKNVKLANDIKLEPEHRQLFQGMIVYFYPNDDTSMVRRTRIHKLIQLGAAWITKWREDVTHIIVDGPNCSYYQLLRHFNRAGLPREVILVKFDPYVPQCIQFGTLLDPGSQRFTIKGAPQNSRLVDTLDTSRASESSQVSLKVKPSRRQITAQSTQKTDSHPSEEDISAAQSVANVSSGEFSDTVIASSPLEETVKDSFILPCLGQAEEDASRPLQEFDDALIEAIREAKASAHLPLDDDDDTVSLAPSSLEDNDTSGTDEDIPEPMAQPIKAFNFVSKASALRDKKTINLNAFQCMDPGANRYTSQNPNARTIEILQDMCKHYDQMNDHWRTLAYHKGITTLKKQSIKIETAKQAAALPFIGSRLADKIEEIVLTNRLRKLDNTREDPLDAVLRLFLGVYGVGLVQANKWTQAGYRTLDDLRNKARLTDSHKVGIEHYDDFNSRIPRAEVEAHGAVVKKALQKINKNFEATIMGSYRRGAKDSGDIDLIITCPDTSVTTLRAVVFDELVPRLYKSGFLKASQATSRQHDSVGTKWHGASCLPGSKIWRRMDFLLVPEEEMGAALIYFTGNDIFNRSIRLLARKKGMRLNQRGLYKDIRRGRHGEKLNEGLLVEGPDEKKIFEILGVPWREPHERIC